MCCHRGCSRVGAVNKSVLIVEDDSRTRDGFVRAVDAADGLRAVGAAATIADGMRMVDALRPDVLLLDMALPDGSGIDLLRHAVKVHPPCLPIVITIFDDDERVIDSIRAGALGYLLKGTADLELVREIEGVCNGGSPISAAIARRLFRWLSGPAHMQVLHRPAAGESASHVVPAGSDVAGLSHREVAVLRLCAKGYRYHEIAVLLAVAQSTIATHIKRIYRKLQVHSKTEAVYEARALGLLDD